MEIFAFIIIGILVISLIGLLLYQIRRDTMTRENNFALQIEMAKGQQSMTKELPWKELKSIVDEVVSFTVINYCISNAIGKMSDNELSIHWNVILSDISSTVELSLSDEIKRQILKSVTIDYLTSYIKNSVQLAIVYNLEKNKSNKYNARLGDIQKKASEQYKKEA